MRVNGKDTAFEPQSLLEFLLRSGYQPDYVVVERGREIITKERFSETFLCENDELNILQFMGGG